MIALESGAVLAAPSVSSTRTGEPAGPVRSARRRRQSRRDSAHRLQVATMTKAGRSGQRESCPVGDHPARTPRQSALSRVGRLCASAAFRLTGPRRVSLGGRGAIFKVCGAFRWGRPFAQSVRVDAKGASTRPNPRAGGGSRKSARGAGSVLRPWTLGRGADPQRAVFRKCRRSNPDCRYSPFSNRANIAILPGLAVRGAVLPVHSSVGRQAAADAAALAAAAG
ncbi:hypothetical protein SAMN04488021_13811 [Paracoccus aminovorans]|uniref:Uncharacterized protein n=1 Tax=Paracoccus aminovorans TaxID=34004 RepID=A0A1I3DFS6_9RHOB|nr:hypothetical protein JCM7685_pAMV3p0113 [Paracoccus aminovorans]SFH85503.1 hypothetical protein SAMN04488021_13811 [Paracoccus aminovorans]